MTETSIEYTGRELASIRRPAELYRFRLPGGAQWLLTSADAEIIHDGETFTPAPIGRGSVSFDTDLKVSQLTVSVDLLKEPALNFLAAWPVELVWVDVLKVFREAPDEARIIFMGQISGATIQGRKADLEVVGFEWFLSQKLPILKYQVSCNWRLFSGPCGLSAAAWSVSTGLTLASSDGLTYYSPLLAGYSDQFFTWGFLNYAGQRRMITGHTGGYVALRYRLTGFSDGDSAVLYAGCDRTIDTCQGKFNNKANYGGFPHIPVENPVTDYASPTDAADQGGKK